jgi:predicted small lipoprotein YifL
MKKVFQILVAVMAVVILANCGGKKGPESVAEKFLKHLNKKEYAEAKKLGTQATVDMIAFLESFPSDEPVEDIKIEEMKCTEEGEKAKCTYKENGNPAEINLVKEGDAWKVDMPKEMPTDDLSFDEEILEEEVTEEVSEVVE